MIISTRSLPTLSVLDGDMETLTRAISWFGDQFSILIEACADSFERIAGTIIRRHRETPRRLLADAEQILSCTSDIEFVQRVLNKLGETGGNEVVSENELVSARSRLEEMRLELLEELTSLGIKPASR